MIDKKVDEIATSEKLSKKEKNPSKGARSRRVTFTSTVVVVFLLLGIWFGAKLWRDWDDHRNGLIAANHLLEARALAFEQQAADLQAAIDELNTAQAELAVSIESNSRMAHRIEAIEESLSGVTLLQKQRWRMEEVEFLIRVAQERIILNDDVAGAIVLFEAADHQLRELNDYALADLRAAIAEDLLTLRSLEEVDRIGLYSRISALATQSDDLALRQHESGDQLESDSVQAPEPGIFERLIGLVRVHDLSDAARPSFLPDETEKVQLTLLLMLEESALALMKGEQELWEASLDRAHTWVEQHYHDSAARFGYLQELDALKSLNVFMHDAQIGAAEDALARFHYGQTGRPLPTPPSVDTPEMDEPSVPEVAAPNDDSSTSTDADADTDTTTPDVEEAD